MLFISFNNFYAFEQGCYRPLIFDPTKVKCPVSLNVTKRLGCKIPGFFVQKLTALPFKCPVYMGIASRYGGAFLKMPE